MYSIRFIPIIAVLLLIAGCDSAYTPSVDDQVAKSKIDLQSTADDYYQTLRSLDSLHHSTQSDNPEKTSPASVLVRYAVMQGEDPDEVRQYVNDLQRILEPPRSPKETISRALENFPSQQANFLEKMFADLQSKRDLGSVSESIEHWTVKAEQEFSGYHLQTIKLVAAYVVGTTRHWTETRGQSLLGGKEDAKHMHNGAKYMHYDCQESPVEENYLNFWERVSNGLNSFAQGCALVGGAGFYFGGVYGATVGCGIGGFPPGIAGYYSAAENQQDQYHQAARAWCDECGSTSWKAAQFCADELPEGYTS